MFILFLNRSIIIMITVSYLSQVSSSSLLLQTMGRHIFAWHVFLIFFPKDQGECRLAFHSSFPLAFIWGSRKHITRIDPLITVWTPGQDGYPLNMCLEASDSNKQPELHVNWSFVNVDLLAFTEHRATCSQDIQSMWSETHPSPGPCLSLHRGHLKRHRHNRRRCHAAGQPVEAEV